MNEAQIEDGEEEKVNIKHFRARFLHLGVETEKRQHNSSHNENMAINQGQGVLAGIPTSEQLINIYCLIL